MLTEDALIKLGFNRYEWEDEGEKFVDHKLTMGNVVIEISNLDTVEITTQGNYINLPNINNDNKLKQFINLLS